MYWKIYIEPFQKADGVEHLIVTMIVINKSGEAVQTISSPRDLLIKRVCETHGEGALEENKIFYDSAAREMKAALDVTPIRWSKEELKLQEDIEKLICGLIPRPLRVSIEVVTALRWKDPLIMGADGFFLSNKECEEHSNGKPPAKVIHMGPLPPTPFLCYLQVEGGEAFSIIVNQDKESGICRGVLLEDHIQPSPSSIIGRVDYNVFEAPESQIQLAPLKLITPETKKNLQRFNFYLAPGEEPEDLNF